MNIGRAVGIVKNISNENYTDNEKAKEEAAGLWTKAIVVYITNP